jgi:hypothetical protein
LIYFYENNWHYYRNWEHLLLQKTPCQNGWPFQIEEGVRKLTYPKNLLSLSDERLACLLVMAINIKMDESVFAKAEELVSEAQKVL